MELLTPEIKNWLPLIAGGFQNGTAVPFFGKGEREAIPYFGNGTKMGFVWNKNGTKMEMGWNTNG